jgi:hypothetical protein
MAPEQLDVDRQSEIGPRTDLYAFGIVVYQMLTGRVPFTGSTSAVMAAQLLKEPPRPSEFKPDLPSGIEAAILKMLSKQSSERFASGEAFMSALEPANKKVTVEMVRPTETPAPPQPAIAPVSRAVLPRATKQNNGLATASLILAIVGLATTCLLSCGAVPILIVAFVTGLVGYRQIKASDGAQGGEWMAVAGICIAALAGFVVVAITVVFVLGSFGPQISNIFSGTPTGVK